MRYSSHMRSSITCRTAAPLGKLGLQLSRASGPTTPRQGSAFALCSRGMRHGYYLHQVVNGPLPRQNSIGVVRARTVFSRAKKTLSSCRPNPPARHAGGPFPQGGPALGQELWQAPCHGYAAASHGSWCEEEAGSSACLKTMQ